MQSIKLTSTVTVMSNGHDRYGHDRHGQDLEQNTKEHSLGNKSEKDDWNVWTIETIENIIPSNHRF